MLPPINWGNEEALEDLFGDTVQSITVNHKTFSFRYKSFDHFINTFRTYYGPMHKAFEALGEKSTGLEDDLRVLAQRFNVAGPDSFVVPSEYAEVIIRT